MNSWNCIVQRFDVVDSADVAKAPIYYHPLLGRSINALIFILLTTCKMQKVDYGGGGGVYFLLLTGTNEYIFIVDEPPQR